MTLAVRADIISVFAVRAIIQERKLTERQGSRVGLQIVERKRGRRSDIQSFGSLDVCHTKTSSFEVIFILTATISSVCDAYSGHGA